MSSTDPVSVSVMITSAGSDGVLSFSGTGTYRLDSRGVHLHYTARDREGHEVCSILHLGAGKALLDNGSYRLLLDPARPTVSRLLDGDEGGVTVTTYSIHDGSSRGEGIIALHYALSIRGQVLQDMQVTLAIRPTEGMDRMGRLALEQAELLILRAWSGAVADGSLTEAIPVMPTAAFSPDGIHGDLMSAFCLPAAWAAGMDARDLAGILLRHAGETPDYLSSVTVAGPGYLNFRLHDRWYEDALRFSAEAILRRRRPESWGLSPVPSPGENWRVSLRRRIVAQALDNVLDRAGRRFICIDDDDHYVNSSAPASASVRLFLNGRELSGDTPPSDLPLDALRFLLCVRLDRPVTIDLDSAAREDRSNPYYRVRYARDRIRRVLCRFSDSGYPVPSPGEADFSAPWDGQARSLIQVLCRWDELTAQAARTADPGLIPEYLLTLADRFWAMRRSLLPEDTGTPPDPARMLLCDTVRLTLDDGLGLLGIST